jgi:hypothetical protein
MPPGATPATAKAAEVHHATTLPEVREHPMTSPDHEVASAALDLLVSELASRLAPRVADIVNRDVPTVTPWLTTIEAIDYSRLPEGTFRALAVVAHDRNAPLVDGCLGIPDAEGLPEGAPDQGVNSMDEQGYVGPAPPAGHGPDHY